MKIIDLLNKIANGEEVPKKIRYNYTIYYYDEKDDNELARYRSEGVFDKWLFDDCYLNDEVEIIEEMTEEEKYVRGWNKYCKAVYDMNNPNSKEEPTTCEEFAKKFQENCKMFQPEEKKIPEKLEEFNIQGLEVSGYSMTQAEYLLEDGVKENREIINWILDYLKSKGE